MWCSPGETSWSNISVSMCSMLFSMFNAVKQYWKMYVYVYACLSNMMWVFFQEETWPPCRLRRRSGAASVWTSTLTPSPSHVDITFAWTASKASGIRRTSRSVRCARRHSENVRNSGSTEHLLKSLNYLKGLFWISFLFYFLLVLLDACTYLKKQNIWI